MVLAQESHIHELSTRRVLNVILIRRFMKSKYALSKMHSTVRFYMLWVSLP